MGGSLRKGGSITPRRKRKIQRSPEEIASLLSGVDILGPLPERKIWDLAWRMPYLSLDSKQLLHTPRYRGNTLFLLLEGRVRVYEINNGREFTLTVVSPGGIFGEMALSAERMQRVYAQALEPSVVGFMSRDALKRLVRDEPEVGVKMIELLADRLSWYAGRMVDLGYREVLERLASMLLYIVEREGVKVEEGFRIQGRYTHRELGSMIGANREAVTNAFGRLQETGAVKLADQHIFVRNIETLKRIARGGILE